MSDQLRFLDLPHGISCIDTLLGRPGVACCYLIREGSKVGFIDIGTANSVPFLLELLQRKGIAREDVEYVMPTHVHLDHAGGTGQLMAALPRAKLLVHPRGARHLINPAKLQAGSTVVYGSDKFAALFGTLIPVDASRVIEVTDGFSLDFNGRALVFIDTPGHARHHYCIYDERTEGIFSGDTCGASYPELNNGSRRFVFPPTTPVQFDPAAWKQTLLRLIELQPQRIYVTHYGMHNDPISLLEQLRHTIDEYAAIAEDCRDSENRQQRISQALMQFSINSLLDSNCGLTVTDISKLLASDMNLNAQGLEHWLTSASRR